MIYADYNGSSFPCPEVISHLQKRLSEGPFGNPNAVHGLGQKLIGEIEKARRICAEVLGAKPSQIIFNSGSSEGISHVFHSILSQTKKKKILVSGIEHSAVVHACKIYAGRGFDIHKVPVAQNGIVDFNAFKKLMDEHANDMAMVSIMAANNETGVIQPSKEIAQYCQKKNVPYFSDTTQYIGKTDFSFEDSGMDYAVLSGHKVGALIGSGILLVKNPEQLQPLIYGGGQECGLRGGTQNYMAIETLAIALKEFHSQKSKLDQCRKNREQFEAQIKKEFPEAVIIGDDSPRLASTTLIALPGISGQRVQMDLESQNIYVTTSSACSDNEEASSKVLKAMGITEEIGRSVVRISLCLEQKDHEYNEIYKAVCKTYKKLKK
ncbi:MAG: cysteine desulfurase [Bacteriovoracaceae bacterium]|nr:cysteine desulfurase [Bacteriovoracaceae bacterium]